MKIHSVFAVALLIAAVGHADYKKLESPFLGSTQQFKKEKGVENLLIFRGSGKKAVEYKKIIFDPVLFYQSPNSRQPQLTEEEIVALGAEFKEMIEDRFKGVVEVVHAPGAGVLRARFAIRGLRRGNYYTDEFGDHKIKPDNRMAAGTFEMEGIDSLTGERVVALVQNLGSERFEKMEKEELPQTIQNLFTNWIAVLKKAYIEKSAAEESKK